MLWMLLLPACGLLTLFPPDPPANCVPRQAFYPDTDGNGVGEPTSVYIGCEAPPGYVDNVDTGTPDTDSDAPDTDTDLPDTDTDVQDTDLSDTDTASGPG